MVIRRLTFEWIAPNPSKSHHHSNESKLLKKNNCKTKTTINRIVVNNEKCWFILCTIPRRIIYSKAIEASESCLDLFVWRVSYEPHGKFFIKFLFSVILFAEFKCKSRQHHEIKRRCFLNSLIFWRIVSVTVNVSFGIAYRTLFLLFCRYKRSMNHTHWMWTDLLWNNQAMEAIEYQSILLNRCHFRLSFISPFGNSQVHT